MKKFADLMMMSLLMIFGLVVGGEVVRYGWNNFVSPAFVVAQISLPTAVGLDVLATYVTGYSDNGKAEELVKDYDGLLKVFLLFIYGLQKSLWTLLIMYVVARFI